jgi:hypothetical protein
MVNAAVVAVLAVAGTVTVPAGAQQTGREGVEASANQGNAAAPRAETETVVKTVTPLDLASTGDDVRAKLSALMKEPGNEFLEQITVIGRGRGTSAPQGTLGQVVWYGIEATVEEELRRAGLRAPLKSSFLAPAPTITEETDIAAKGDLESLIEDARRLLEDPEAEDAEGSEANADEENSRREESRNGRSSTSGGGGRNDVAGWYNPIDYPDSGDDKETVVPAPGFQLETSDGCSPRILEDQGLVIAQSRIVTYQDGKITDEGTCTDTMNRYPVQRTYLGCDDSVDLQRMIANPMYRTYYVDDNGVTQYFGECKVDKEMEFPIVKDGQSCAAIIDMEAGTVIRAYELVYSNRTGVRTVVGNCRPDENDVLPIEYITTGCGYRHDVPNSVSFAQHRAVYYEDGIERSIGQCEDTGSPIPHVLDVAACEPIVDMDAKTVVPRARRLIETEVGQVTIAECAPVEEMAHDLLVSSQGCETTFIHNVAAGQSFRTLRYFHEVTGSRKYVTECILDEGAEPILHHQEIAWWVHDDARKASKPATRVYIEVDGEEFEVSGAQVRPGTSEVPYVLQKTEEIPDPGSVRYSSCSKYVGTKRRQIYQRPDGSTVAYEVGAGAEQGPVNACTVLPPDTAFVDAHVSGTINTTEYYWCRYRVRSAQRREDGPTIYGSWVTPAKEAGGAGNYRMATRRRESGSDGGSSKIVWGNGANIGNPSSGIAHSQPVNSGYLYCYRKLHDGDAANLCSAVGCQ